MHVEYDGADPVGASTGDPAGISGADRDPGYDLESPAQLQLFNLLVRWVTAGMTAAAFVLVVGLLIVMLAFVNGMYHLTQTSGQPGNVIILADGATDEQFSSLAMADIGDIENQPGIRVMNGRPMVSRETYIVVNQPIENPPPGRQKRRFLQVRGVDDPVMSAAVHGLQLEPGRRLVLAGGRRRRWQGPPPMRLAAVQVIAGSRDCAGTGLRPLAGGDFPGTQSSAARRGRYISPRQSGRGWWPACFNRPARRMTPKSGPSSR